MIKKISLLGLSLLALFIILEIGIRIIDPFPYISKEEINHSEYGNLLQYDSLLGWKGTPGTGAPFNTRHFKTTIHYNSKGFRDIEHQNLNKPALVFIGDSFVWGHGVDFEESFVQRLRPHFPNHNLFNLSERGYGTDQQLLLFQNWSYPGPIEKVLLFFTENDLDDNMLKARYSKFKPKFELEGGTLTLTHVPVPLYRKWEEEKNKARTPRKDSLTEKILAHSHLIRDIALRVRMIYRQTFDEDFKQSLELVKGPSNREVDLTRALLNQFKKETEKRGAGFEIIFIPSKIEIENLDDQAPYQSLITPICQKENIPCFDLAPAFQKPWRRLYFRRDMHWNKQGHKQAAKTIRTYLEKKFYE